MLNGIIVDGNEYDMVASITRTAKIEQTDVSGLMMNREYYNDTIATYMEYEVSLSVPIGRESEYSALYNILADPVAEHYFILPYNQGWIKIFARVESISDEYYKDEDGRRIWRKTSFTIIATRPSWVR